MIRVTKDLKERIRKRSNELDISTTEYITTLIEIDLEGG